MERRPLINTREEDNVYVEEQVDDEVEDNSQDEVWNVFEFVTVKMENCLNPMIAYWIKIDFKFNSSIGKCFEKFVDFFFN